MTASSRDRVGRLSAFRRAVRSAVVAAAVAGGCSAPPGARPPQPPAPGQAAASWCRPGQACWPTERDWQALRSSLHGSLEVPASPFAPCQADAASDACAAALRSAKNPFYLEDQPGGTESAGWLDAWSPAQSVYAVVARDAGDVAAAVNFARDHHLRLAIKGTGHDYLGRSNAPDSLLVWTHQMRQITVVDAFVARGCSSHQPGIPAVSLEAGTRWLEVYQEVTGKHGRYVQGGGCTSVGAAGGFLQGGGFGSWSKKYGIAAASMVEAEVVTAGGTQIVANACQHQDLFWALRGGGGGTFGVVTKVTLMTHPLPSHFGVLRGQITAKTDAAFRELLGHFVAFYRERLSNEHWGEQVAVAPDNTLRLSLGFEGMTGPDAEQVWQPFRAWLEQHPERFTIELSATALPGDKMWSFEFFHQYARDAIKPDDRPGVPAGMYWWAGDAEEVSIYWYAYRSRWIPQDRFEGAQADKLATALFDASRHWTVLLHINKGQAGASADAVRRGRETSMNPAVFRAAVLALLGSGGDGVPGVAGHEPDLARAGADKAKVDAAMQILRDATPDAGSYVNETDYFEPAWQHEFWGDNYPRLLAIKRAYDPDGMFVCHHCVGSEGRVP